MALTKDDMTMHRTYKDDVTGVVGKLTGIGNFDDGTDQGLLQPPVDKDGKVPEKRWVDVRFLSFVD